MSKINSEDYEKIEKINLEQQKAIKENAKAVVMKEIQEENDRKNYNEKISYFEKNKDKNVALDSKWIKNFIKLRNLHAIFRQKDAKLAKNVPAMDDSKLNRLSENVAENLI